MFLLALSRRCSATSQAECTPPARAIRPTGVGRAAHRAMLTAWVLSGCVAESSESTASGGTDSGSTTADASFRNVFPEIPADTSSLVEPAERPMPEELGREQTYIPCATNRDCFRQTGSVDFGDSGQEHEMPCGVTQRRSNFCVRTTVGDQRYTACMPTSSGVSAWIADYCPGRRTAPWEQPLYPQCDVCEMWALGGTCGLTFSDFSDAPDSYRKLIQVFQAFNFAVRAFPEFDSPAGLRHYHFARSSCQGLYCRGPADCPTGLECICIDDSATPPGFFGTDPDEPIVYCNAASPDCRCRGADADAGGGGGGPTADPPAGPGACLWPTYEGAAPEGAAP